MIQMEVKNKEIELAPQGNFNDANGSKKRRKYSWS